MNCVVATKIFAHVLGRIGTLFGWRKGPVPAYVAFVHRTGWWDKLSDHARRESARGADFLPVCLGGGVALYFSRTAEPRLWVAFLACALAWASAGAVWRHGIGRAAALCLAAAASGFLAGAVGTWRTPAWEGLPRTACVVSGLVVLVETLPAGQRVTIQAPSLDDAVPLRRSLRIRLKAGDSAVVSPGDLVRVRALVRPPAPPDYPGGRDTQRDAFFAGIAGFGFALGPIAVMQAAEHSGWASFRAGVAERVMQSLPSARGAVAAAMLTGIGTAIPEADRLAFQTAGLAHLLAVAGLHVGIVMGLVFGSVRFGLAAWELAALHWPAKQLASLAALSAGAFYLALTGGHVPILRSFAMACLVTLAVLTGRRVVSLRGLSIAACLIMLAAPHEVVGVSFQMSFSAVLALIAGYQALRPAVARMRAGSAWQLAALYVAGLAMTSLLAGTASLPFAIYHFGRATLWYVPANLLAVPLTAFWVMPWGVASLVLMPLGLERLALAPMGFGISGLLWIAHAVAAWPAASLAVPQMPPWGLCLVALGLAWLALCRGVGRLAGLPALALGVASPFLARMPDIVVGPDAAVIAWRAAGQVYVAQTSRASTFETAMPERVFGAAATACSAKSCLPGGGIVLARDPEAASCTGAALLVSAGPLRDGCPGVARIDRFSVWRDGASEGWRSGSILTDRDVRGRRPWVIGRGSFLPPAKAE